MGRVMIVGAGGVGRVAAYKCAQVPEVFDTIVLASRTEASCQAIADDVRAALSVDISTAQVDADHVPQMVELLRAVRPDVVLNVALPYQDLHIMDACLEVGAHYLDTANYEPRDVAKFEYKWQWAYQDRFREAGLMALLGSGFDPGVTNVYCAYAKKHLFDEIRSIDIVDCNGGTHGKAFATNFNPEINLREVTAPARHYENGAWQESPALSIHQPFDFPGVGEREMYLMYHEELESLSLNIEGVRCLRFWMTFGDEYLTHLRVLENVGMTRIDPVDFEGTKVVPLQFLKAVLPNPSSLAAGYTGRTCIGCVVEGTKSGEDVRQFIYNICDHAECYSEVGSQAVSYTTGVPAMIGAKLMLQGPWMAPGVFNMEQLDPDPFMNDLNRYGLPWKVVPWTHSVK